MMMPKLLITIFAIFSSSGTVVCLTNSSHIYFVLYGFCSRTHGFLIFFMSQVFIIDICEVMKLQVEVLCIYHVNVKHRNVLLQICRQVAH